MRAHWVAVLALLTAPPLAAQNAKPDVLTQAAIGGGMRVTPGQWNAMPTPAGVSFATGVTSFTSQFGSSAAWFASRAVGFPDVYPRHGDLPGAWAPASTASPRDELVLQFSGALTQEIWVFETWGVARPITALRLVVSPVSVAAYPEIDAVAIVPTLAGLQLAPGAVK